MKPRQPSSGGRPARRQRSQPAVGRGEHQREHAAQRHAVDQRAGAQPGRALQRTTDQLDLGLLVVHGVLDVRLERDGAC